MLLSFQIENYKSFRDKTVFSMTKAPYQTGLDYSILNEKIGSKKYAGLSSAVIYGPNASGKTNLIGAMDTMKSIVLRGNIRNSDDISSPNTASFKLELIPNCKESSSPISFGISFIESGMLFEYNFSFTVGAFLEKDQKRKIEEEKLLVNGKPVFVRDSVLAVNKPSSLKQLFNSSVYQNFNTAVKLAQNGLNDEELFLCNGFKTIFSKEIVSTVLNWFEQKFIVIYRSDAIRTMKKFADPKEDTVYVAKTLTEAAKEFGITSNALGYKAEGENTVLCSLFEDKKLALPAESFESFGTIRFVNEFPLVINALVNGATLVMDEFDASIHPMALMNVIGIFHNDEININHAQLIFNTHNPIFLDASLFRRDEIKFVERDDETGYSTHYALSDFKTANGIRKGEDYMSNYFVSRYGAIKDVDFSSILEKIISESKDKRNG